MWKKARGERRNCTRRRRAERSGKFMAEGALLVGRSAGRIISQFTFSRRISAGGARSRWLLLVHHQGPWLSHKHTQQHALKISRALLLILIWTRRLFNSDTLAPLYWERPTLKIHIQTLMKLLREEEAAPPCTSLFINIYTRALCDVCGWAHNLFARLFSFKVSAPWTPFSILYISRQAALGSAG